MAVIFERDLVCTLRDGTPLKANIFRPDTPDPMPVLLVRIPYGKDGIINYTYANPLQLAEAGYIVAVQDVRGTFASGGTFGDMSQEINDGWDAVEWASKLPGSNGSVGMYGASYFAWTQLAAAATGHPALKTIVPTIPHISGDNSRGGVVEWGLFASWLLSMLPAQLMRTAQNNPQFPAKFAKAVHIIDHMRELVYPELPLSRFSAIREFGVFSEYLRPLDARTADSVPAIEPAATPRELQVSALVIGGWYDLFLGNALTLYRQFREAGRNVKLLIGPWTHTSGPVNYVGEVDFGLAASGIAIDLRHSITDIHRQWFDAQLKGQPEGANEPAVRIFTMGENRWRTAPDWPLPDTTPTAFYLISSGGANTAAGDGRLTRERSLRARTDHFVYDPANPVPTVGGNTLMTPSLPAGPYDQREVEQREDVLVYTSAPLEAPLRIAGGVTARLYVASDAPDTDFVVRLTDVHPDGRSINIVDGITRMRYRAGAAPGATMTGGAVYEVSVDCWATSHVFLPGHRLRVQVTSSCFPRWNRNLNTGGSNEHDAEFRTAHQAVLHGPEHPSHILLPVALD
jgi:putative CocE/NonD family hydrolase